MSTRKSSIVLDKIRVLETAPAEQPCTRPQSLLQVRSNFELVMYAVYRCCWGREVRQGGNLSIRKSRKICGGQGRSGPNGVASSNFVVKGAQVEIHSDRLVTSKIDTVLVDFRKI